MKKETLSKEELQRRLNIIGHISWQDHSFEFQCTPRGAEWDNLPIDDKNPTRGILKSIELQDDKVVIRTANCYKYRFCDGHKEPCPNLTVEFPHEEIVPDAHGD